MTKVMMKIDLLEKDFGNKKKRELISVYSKFY
jgi:hypothetical protein